MPRSKRAVATAALAAAISLALGQADPGRAGEAQDRIFAMRALDGVPVGETLAYRHQRLGSVAQAPALPPVTDGTVEVSITASASTEGRDAVVSLTEGARTRTLNPFPAAAGNPLLMVFMETSVRSMATAAGGSPFYIRNRMREALRTQDVGAPVSLIIDGATVAGQRYAFRPFAGDPNAERMGAFAEMEIAFTVTDAVPGGFALLEAVTGPDDSGAPALSERFVYAGLEDQG